MADVDVPFSFPADWGRASLVELSDFITKGTTPTTLGFQWAPYCGEQGRSPDSSRKSSPRRRGHHARRTDHRRCPAAQGLPARREERRLRPSPRRQNDHLRSRSLSRIYRRKSRKQPDQTIQEARLSAGLSHRIYRKLQTLPYPMTFAIFRQHDRRSGPAKRGPRFQMSHIRKNQKIAVHA